jgi:alpha-tubulin suppressor-like RCC1 family protein
LEHPLRACEKIDRRRERPAAPGEQALMCWAPVPVPGFTSGVRQVAAGASFTCALRQAGDVWCFGSNLYGQLGYGAGVPPGCTGDPSNPQVGVSCRVPQRVSGINDAVQITAADFHVCARLAGGEVRCWGNNSVSQLGNGGAPCVVNGYGVPYCNTPQHVVGLPPAIEVKAGGGDGVSGHVCARDAARNTRCWGRADLGVIGIGRSHPSCIDIEVPPDGISDICPVPVLVPGAAGALQLATGEHHACAVVAGSAGREARCWGNNSFGELGLGDTQSGGITVCEEIGFNNGSVDICRVPVPVPALAGLRQIAAGWARSFSVLGSGALVGFGTDNGGALGIGDARPPPAGCIDTGLVLCSEPVPVVGLGAGFPRSDNSIDHSCAATAGGATYCWGQNGLGALGVGRTVPPGCVDTSGDGIADRCSVPVRVYGL